MHKDRNWTVLFIGGASGTGKSSVANKLADYFHVNIMEVDDIYESVEAMSTKELYPAVHYWNTGVNWRDIGVEGNVKWLIDVSQEMIPAIKAVVENHLEGDVPIIIEGDFIYPEFTKSFNNPKVKSIFLYEPDKDQIVQNYFSREGGELQSYRADCSAGYGEWLVKSCKELNIDVVEARPWNNAVERIISVI